MKRAILSISLFVALSALLIGHSELCQAFFSDDAFISLRYAERFALGHGLTWNDGERVEGYSNPLWVVLIAFTSKTLALGWIEAVRGLAGFCTLATLALLVGRGSWGSALLSGAAFASSAVIAAWMMGGLEQPMVALFLVAGVTLLTESVFTGRFVPLLLATVSFLLLALTRSDGALWGILAAGILLVRRVGERRLWRSALVLAFVVVLTVVVHTAWRYQYYGDWVSNVAHIKVGFSLHRLGWGIRYVGLGVMILYPLIMLWGLLAHRSRRDPRARFANILCLILTLSWLGYLTFIGGDVNPPLRHFVPIIALLCWGIHASYEGISGRDGRPIHWSAGSVAIFFVALFQFLYGELREARGNFSEGVWQRLALGIEMGMIWHDRRPLVAVNAAGALPFSSRLPILDTLGLNDRYIALHPSPEVGKGWIGHEFGDARYILSRSPDIFVLEERDPNLPFFYVNRALLAEPEFHRIFQEVYWSVPPIENYPLPHTARIWMRRIGGTVGVHIDDEGVSIPAWLCANSPERPVRRSPENRLLVTLNPGESCAVELPSAATEYPHTFHTQPSGTGIRAKIDNFDFKDLRLIIVNESSDPTQFWGLQGS